MEVEPLNNQLLTCNVKAAVASKMGNICSSCCKDEAKYARTGDDETSFHNDPGTEFNSTILQEFDMRSSVFEGASVYQKFTSKQNYEPRFVWVNLETRTIHMSVQISKERRHKEASLERF